MRFSVLGPIEVETAPGSPHPIGSANQRAILAMLLARPGAVVTVDELIDGVWGDGPPASARQSLRTYVSRLRRLVGDRLVGHDGGYSINCGPEELDSVDFEREVADGRYGAALARWRGRPFGDAADLPVARTETVRLEALARTARSGRLAELLRLGRVTDAIAGAEAVVADEPVDEGAWAVLVRALAGAGRTAEALRAYQRAAGNLAEIGLTPGPALRQAETDALVGPEPAPDPPPEPSRRQAPSRPLTPSIGRSAEIERLADVTTERRLVTIVGPGGVGKTRLALEVGRAVATRHGLGTRVVELSRIAEPSAIEPAVRRALDLGERDVGVAKGLGAFDALVVIDNCEHLIDAVAAEVVSLLDGGDSLRILATSREPLGIAGELRWVLAPLSTVGPDSPALALFAERARDVGVEVDIDDPRARAVVAHLDGLPLAVEMAAARLATVGLADLDDELSRTVATLGSAQRGVTDRHETLRAVLAWSEALLSTDERRALADFSVFAGPVTAPDLPAAIEVDDPVPVVCALAERSLVTVDDPGDGRARYGSLETIRAFGRERLVAEERAATVGRRHSEWFVAAAEEAGRRYDGPEQGSAVARIDEILDELRAAHAWSRSHDPALALRLSHALFQPALQGMRLEVFDWSRALADRLDGHERPLRLWGEVAHGLSMTGRIDDARRWAERAIIAAPDDPETSVAYAALSDCDLYIGDLDASVAAARNFERLLDERSTLLERVYVVADLALPLAYAGRRREALEVIPEEPPPGASPTARGWLAYARGEVLLEIDLATAQRELDRSVALADSVDSHFLLGVAQVSAASLRARTGDPAEAAGALARTVERFADRGNSTHLLTTLRNLPPLLIRLRRWTAAAELLGGLDAVAISPTFGDEADRLAESERRARAELGADDFASAHRRGAARSLDDTARHAVELLDEVASRR